MAEMLLDPADIEAPSSGLVAEEWQQWVTTARTRSAFDVPPSYPETAIRQSATASVGGACT